MKLHQTYLSPFPTRVRLLIYAKQLEVEIVRPPGFHGDGKTKGDYLSLNPMGRVPALELDDGTVIPESEVICEYLEERFPEPQLRPEDPVLRSRMRLLSRISDTYIVMAMVPLFDQIEKPPREWDQEAIRKALREIDRALGYLEHYLGDGRYAVGERLTQADGALIPILLLIDEWLPIFRGPKLLDNHPRTARYWQGIGEDEIAKRLIDETREALLAQM